jgi:uncharacterized protein (DUF169 family)
MAGDITSGGALGGCSDITALPLLEGIANVTFLGLGCRLKAAIDGCHLMMGAPGSALETIHTPVLDMAKPITMLKKAHSAVEVLSRVSGLGNKQSLEKM